MKKYIFSIILLALALSSCEDFLDQNPDSRASLDSPDNISALLVAAYPSMSAAWFTEIMSDNTTDVGSTAPADAQDLQQLYNWEHADSEEQDSPDGYWYSCYTAIAAANAALEAVGALEAEGSYAQSELNPLIGEALMCRAYCHFMLVNLFAEHYDPTTAASTLGIPYVTTVETQPIVNYERLSVEDVYTAIENDMLEGFDLISDDAYGAPKWHFNKQAAATFISRFYLYRGLDSDWEEVVKYASDALKGNPSAYLRDWLTTYGQSFDVFGSNYSKSAITANFQIQSKMSSGCRAWYYRYTMDLPLLRKRVVYGDPHPTTTDITNDFVFINKAGGNTTYGCYGVFKFVEEFKRDGINADYGYPYVMYTTFVAEEALFNLMEAYVMQENYEEVISLLNLYYSTRIIDYNATAHAVTQANIVSKYSDDSNGDAIAPHFALNSMQEIYLKCLVNIRATEFITEGQRWFDIKRMHIVVNHELYDGGTLTLTADDERRVISIPDDAVDYVYDAETSTALSEDNADAYERSSYYEIMNKYPELTTENE